MLNNDPAVEIEEAYDARLEREEIERHEAERKEELERIKTVYGDKLQNRDGLRFKGSSYSGLTFNYHLSI
jgi:peptidyl-prolyl isomerase G (cyclophilin G)